MEKEYLMLREEILLLEKIVDNTLNYFYVFVSAVLLFSIKTGNPLHTLIAYVVIIPSYLVVASKTNGIRKIGAYLQVFLEGGDFNWETRCNKLYSMNNNRTFLSSKISSFNYPFIFTSTFVTIVFLAQTQWAVIDQTIEFLKVLLAALLYVTQLILIAKNKKLRNDKYIPYWEDVKKAEH